MESLPGDINCAWHHSRGFCALALISARTPPRQSAGTDYKQSPNNCQPYTAVWQKGGLKFTPDTDWQSPGCVATSGDGESVSSARNNNKRKPIVRECVFIRKRRQRDDVKARLQMWTNVWEEWLKANMWDMLKIMQNVITKRVFMIHQEPKVWDF